jgi:hypothetical protein
MVQMRACVNQPLKEEMKITAFLSGSSQWEACFRLAALVAWQKAIYFNGLSVTHIEAPTHRV